MQCAQRKSFFHPFSHSRTYKPADLTRAHHFGRLFADFFLLQQFFDLLLDRLLRICSGIVETLQNPVICGSPCCALQQWLPALLHKIWNDRLLFFLLIQIYGFFLRLFSSLFFQFGYTDFRRNLLQISIRIHIRKFFFQIFTDLRIKHFLWIPGFIYSSLPYPVFPVCHLIRNQMFHLNHLYRKFSVLPGKSRKDPVPVAARALPHAVRKLLFLPVPRLRLYCLIILYFFHGSGKDQFFFCSCECHI